MSEMISSPEIRTPIIYFMIFVALVFLGKKLVNRQS